MKRKLILGVDGGIKMQVITEGNVRQQDVQEYKTKTMHLLMQE